MPLYAPPFTSNAPALWDHNARDIHFSGCDTAEPLDVFPRYSEVLKHVINKPLPAFLLQGEAPPPMPHVQPDLDALSNLGLSIYNHPPPHAAQQARETEDTFDINFFINPLQPLNPDNPYHGAVAPLDSDSLCRYHALGMAKPYAEIRNAAELLTMGNDEFELIDAVRAYAEFEMGRRVDGADDSLPWTAPHPCAGNVPVSAAVRCVAPDMDDVLDVQDLDSLEISTHTPVPAADTVPSRYLQWLGGCGAPAPEETELENQVVLCASNAEDAQPPGWTLG